MKARLLEFSQFKDRTVKGQNYLRDTWKMIPLNCCNFSRKESLVASECVGKLVNYLTLIYRESKTSKTSLKAFTVKSTLVERWLNYREGFPVEELLDIFEGDELYVLRQIRRSAKARRIQIFNDKIEPTEGLLTDLETWSRKANLSVELVDDRYRFRYDSNLCWLLNRLSELSLLDASQASLLGLLVELAVWEFGFSSFDRSGVSSSHIENRVGISKSTLSSLLHKGEHHTLIAKQNVSDQRRVDWRVIDNRTAIMKIKAIAHAIGSEFYLPPIKSRPIQIARIRVVGR